LRIHLDNSPIQQKGIDTTIVSTQLIAAKPVLYSAPYSLTNLSTPDETSKESPSDLATNVGEE